MKMRTIVQNISGTFDEITEFVPLNYESGKIISCERMFANIVPSRWYFPYVTKSHCFRINFSTKKKVMSRKCQEIYDIFFICIRSRYYVLSYRIKSMWKNQKHINFNICEEISVIIYISTSVAYLLSANLLAIYIAINALNSMILILFIVNMIPDRYAVRDICLRITVI